ncbi:hypothetical protein IW261DRAFT_1426222 [Armillaria novae-zelandiae]|uniref:Uncharacterized protein n=1 Tax=Armillaria novae-zelandiae TaxID=153914 RepID=A0AA39NN40_9AGAR|nr:hypothetical protein IW261DRAFT_1426222 [Armillaria novae-zelandiae]
MYEGKWDVIDSKVIVTIPTIIHESVSQELNRCVHTYKQAHNLQVGGSDLPVYNGVKILDLNIFDVSDPNEDGYGIAHLQSSWWEEGTAGQRLEHGPTARQPPVPRTLDQCGIPMDIRDRLAMSGCVTAMRIEAGLGTNRGRICPCQWVGADATLVTF